MGIHENHESVYERRALEAFENEGTLSSRLMTDYVLAKARQSHDPATRHVTVQLADIMRRFDEAVDEFAKHVWAAWLKGYFRENAARGHEANSGNVNVLVWGSAGRVMVSLRRRDREDDVHHVTFIGSDGEHDGLGLQGINFHGEKAIQLVHEATFVGPSLETDIRPNSKAGMG